MSFHAVLGSYVDDAFGGTHGESNSQLMMDSLTITGQRTSTFINPSKSRGPATRLVILGLLYCSLTSTCRLGEAKRKKYLTRISQALKGPITSKQLEKLAGNLGFAA